MDTLDNTAFSQDLAEGLDFAARRKRRRRSRRC